LVTKLAFKITSMVLATEGNWSLKINFLSFGYQNELVSKLVSN